MTSCLPSVSDNSISTARQQETEESERQLSRWLSVREKFTGVHRKVAMVLSHFHRWCTTSG